MGKPDHLTCLLRNLFVGQEATVRTPYGTTDWFKIEKEVWQVCLLSPCLFNLDAEHIMRNARLDDLQAGIKIDGGNINDLRYVDDTTLMAETEEDLKSLLMRVKEGSKRVGLRLNIKKTKIMASGHVSSVQFSSVAQSCPTLCNPMDIRLLHPWDFLGKSTGVGCHFLFQGIFLTQASNPGLPHCRQMLYRLSHQGSPTLYRN